MEEPMDIESLTLLYRCFVRSEQPLDPKVQVGMVRSLLAGEEFSLLAEFAKRIDVSPEADALIKECANPQVIAGWASRSRIDTTEVLKHLSGETRVTALMPLAGASNLPPEIYGMLLRRNSSRITKALLANGGIPSEAKKEFLPEFVAALEHPDRRGRLYQRAGEIGSFVGRTYPNGHGDVDLTLGVLALTNDPVVLTCALVILEEDFPARYAEGIALVVSRIKNIVCLQRDDKTITTAASCDASGIAELLEVLSSEDLDPMQLKHVRAALAISTAWFKKLRCEKLLKDAKSQLSPRGRETLAEVSELASTVDGGRAKALIRKLIVTTHARAESATCQKARKAAVGNPGIPVELMLSHSEYLNDDDRQILVKRWLKEGRTEAAAKLLYDEYNLDDYLDHIGDAAILPLIEATVRVALERNECVPTWVLCHKALFDDPQLALSLLPWKSIYEISTTDPYSYRDDTECNCANGETGSGKDADGTASTDRVYQAAQRIIVEQLGSDTHKWETFASLSEEFDGTLPDLLHAAATL